MSTGNRTGGTPATTDDTRGASDPFAAAAGYRAWDWPVTLHCGQIRLNLDGDTTALIIPVLLATEVTAILAQRRCPVPVLVHPYAPEHHILLAAERFGVPLPWPPRVHQVTGALLLPPTVTACGPITWIRPPQADALRLCREIDLLAALRCRVGQPAQFSGDPPVHLLLAELDSLGGSLVLRSCSSRVRGGSCSIIALAHLRLVGPP